MMLPVQKIGLVPINGRYDLRLTLQPGTPEQHWNPKMHTEIPMPGGHLAWEDIPEAGTVKFGIWCDRSEDRLGHGGYWSSRAGVVGPMINKKLVWLGINNMSMHMTVEKVEELFKTQRTRPFVRDIETDSTIEPDQMAEKQARVEFGQALHGLLSGLIPALQQAPQIAPLGAEFVRYTVSGFKVDRSMDEAIDKFAEAMEQYQPPPQEQGEDPALAQMQMQVEQIKAQAAQAKGEADIQIAQLKLQGEQMKAQVGQLDAEKTAAEIEKLRAEVQEILAGIGMERQKLQIEGQKVAQDAQAQQQDVALQREGMQREGEQADRQFAADQQRAKAEDKRADRQVEITAKKTEADIKTGAKKTDAEVKAMNKPKETK